GPTSDLTVEARGPTPAAVFAAATDALLAATIASPERLGTSVRRRVAFEEPTLELLLLRWLDEWIYLRDAEQLLMRAASVAVTRAAAQGGAAGEGAEAGWRPEAELAGEPIDAAHELLTDVKAPTAHGLRVAETAGGWEARVTL